MTRKIDIVWTPQYDFYELRKRSMVPMQDETYLLYMFLENPGRGYKKELIYIGIVKSMYRDLFMRMNEHRKAWLSKISKGDIFVKFGTVYTNDKADGRLLEDVESALVFGEQPRENTSKMMSYTLYEDVIVCNDKAEGFLKRKYSTATQREKGE